MERRFPARDQRAGHCPPFDNYNIIHLWYPTHPSQNQLNQFMRVHVCKLNTVEAVDFPKWRIGCIWTLKESICCPPPLSLSFLVPIRLNKRFFIYSEPFLSLFHFNVLKCIKYFKFYADSKNLIAKCAQKSYGRKKYLFWTCFVCILPHTKLTFIILA